jgi:NAD(P)-dependent dehydrogenase (short-subunit alcohol dehydrogenase family)
MASDHRLQGRVVLVTGAAGGIGRALAHAFAAQGSRLMLLDREAAPLAELVSELVSELASELSAAHASSATDLCHAVCDLGDDAQVARVAEQVRQRWGRLDVLVNNAGTEYPTPLVNGPPEVQAQAVARWASLLDNNVVGMVRLTQALLPLMARGASVINQSSIWGQTGVADFSAYSASKHAVVGLTRSWALELGTRGIRVNAVCPGWVRTAAALRSLTAMAQTQGRTEAEVERDLLARQAVPTMLAPSELAGVFLFLASDDAAPLTGQCLSASHGEVML